MTRGQGRGPLRREDLHRALDGELSRTGTRRLERRLREDPATRRELEGLRQLSDAASELLRPEAAPDLKKRVMRELRSGPPARPPGPRRKR